MAASKNLVTKSWLVVVVWSVGVVSSASKSGTPSSSPAVASWLKLGLYICTSSSSLILSLPSASFPAFILSVDTLLLINVP